ncbi:phosphate transporter [Arthrobacter sp. RIT-PI-e]|uniref:inorganic phosphate transporter n=1 Tax=Arthrobacter sp. RIT-PI-e TaxID=1681197 RepID=UPI00067634D0|nr:inorganic phosphate transporter [Arthrobacter sp. RIT-PI-e]KNC17709.1 phosphate transporter [Arthrobacter sp. RIT-PI-e]
MEPFLLGAVIVAAGGFAFLNGFHDVSNSVATAVRTRALTPTIAVLLASAFSLVGVLLSTSLALFLTDLGVGLPSGTTGLGILLAALGAAGLWGVLTWYHGKPSSSTHALLGGVIGAGGASQLTHGPVTEGVTQALLLQIALPLLISPVIAFVLAYLAVFPATWLLRHRSPASVNRRNRMGQSVLAGAFALGHGLQDGQRTMAVVLLALVGSGYATGSSMPLWVQLFAAVLLAAGSLFGGWRITHTLGNRLVSIDPLRGMAAQGVSSVMLFLGAISLHLPLSSSHTMTSAIVGAGANQRFASVERPRVAAILAVWLGTAPVTALLGAVFLLAVSPLL